MATQQSYLLHRCLSPNATKTHNQTHGSSSIPQTSLPPNTVAQAKPNPSDYSNLILSSKIKSYPTSAKKLQEHQVDEHASQLRAFSRGNTGRRHIQISKPIEHRQNLVQPASILPASLGKKASSSRQSLHSNLDDQLWQPDDTPVQFNQMPATRVIQDQSQAKPTTIKISAFLKQQKSSLPRSLLLPNGQGQDLDLAERDNYKPDRAVKKLMPQTPIKSQMNSKPAPLDLYRLNSMTSEPVDGYRPNLMTPKNINLVGKARNESSPAQPQGFSPQRRRTQERQARDLPQLSFKTEQYQQKDGDVLTKIQQRQRYQSHQGPNWSNKNKNSDIQTHFQTETSIKKRSIGTQQGSRKDLVSQPIASRLPTAQGKSVVRFQETPNSYAARPNNLKSITAPLTGFSEPNSTGSRTPNRQRPPIPMAIVNDLSRTPGPRQRQNSVKPVILSDWQRQQTRRIMLYNSQGTGQAPHDGRQHNATPPQSPSPMSPMTSHYIHKKGLRKLSLQNVTVSGPKQRGRNNQQKMKNTLTAFHTKLATMNGGGTWVKDDGAQTPVTDGERYLAFQSTGASMGQTKNAFNFGYH